MYGGGGSNPCAGATGLGDGGAGLGGGLVWFGDCLGKGVLCVLGTANCNDKRNFFFKSIKVFYTKILLIFTNKIFPISLSILMSTMGP